jgi:DNA-binding transcriptional ArsR family regulator
LTNNFVKGTMADVLDVAVIDDPKTAAVALDPTRARLLDELSREPASATEIAARTGVSRQRINYHLRTLEEHGLLELVDVRTHGGITERRLRATAARYIVSPAAIAADGARPERIADRTSAAFLVGLGARLVQEVGELVRRTERSERRLPTFAVDSEIRFASAEDRRAFADELTAAVTGLVARYHHDDGRPHRLVVVAHPTPPGMSPPGATAPAPSDPAPSEPAASEPAPTEPAPADQEETPS